MTGTTLGSSTPPSPLAPRRLHTAGGDVVVGVVVVDVAAVVVLLPEPCVWKGS